MKKVSEILKEANQNISESKLVLSKGEEEKKFSEALKKIKKLAARSNGSFQEAMIQAGYYAKKNNQTIYVYSGNSYGTALWRATFKPSEYLCPIGNTGTTVFSVTPELEVFRHDVKRPDYNEGKIRVYVAYALDLFNKIDQAGKLPIGAIVYDDIVKYHEIDKADTIEKQNTLAMFKSGNVILFSCQVPEDCLKKISGDEYKVIKDCKFTRLDTIKDY